MEIIPGHSNSEMAFEWDKYPFVLISIYNHLKPIDKIVGVWSLVCKSWYKIIDSKDFRKCQITIGDPTLDTLFTLTNSTGIDYKLIYRMYIVSKKSNQIDRKQNEIKKTLISKNLEYFNKIRQNGDKLIYTNKLLFEIEKISIKKLKCSIIKV